MNTPVEIYLALLLPALILAILALAVLIVEAFFPESFLGMPTPISTAVLSLAGFSGAGIVAGVNWNRPPLVDESGMLRLDPFTVFLTLVFCLGGILTVLLSIRTLEREGSGIGEYYGLLLFSAAGAYLMAAANHLIIVFLGLEVLSVAIYPLAGFLRKEARSNEAALKYFLLGAFSSAFLLYGIALIYGATGIAARAGAGGVRENLPGHPAAAVMQLGLLRFDEIARYVVTSTSFSPVFWGGVALLLVGFCFKSALAPFHMWTPDVYDGAPTPITAYMSAIVKAAAFAPFFRFFLTVLGRQGHIAGTFLTYGSWGLVLSAIAILTMTWGNLAAVAEPSMKRMLAYSSVAHAGYIAVGLVAQSTISLLFYTVVYTLMVVGSFGCVALVRRRSGEEALQISEWTGLGLRYPWLGAAMSLFLFALAGFPPTAGFIGKLTIFRAALETGPGAIHQNGYVALVSIALLNSLISVYYYVRVVLALYRSPSAEQAAEPAREIHVQRDPFTAIAIALCAVGVLLLGIYPQFLLGPLSQAFSS